MKKIIIIAIIAFTTMQSFAQSPSEKGKSDINQTPENKITTFAYRLFPTDNMWTFIKLNTRNGQMWQVQYSISHDKRRIFPIE
ncbi:hypothetical protein [Aureibaculum luteum]|uniref:hypothetical protein n=1 Tax=Aureibaculum luteum TaxID=1548456 RepID=UPI000E50C903|nr:hypothetical protein [Aureibaculum luteum]